MSVYKRRARILSIRVSDEEYTGLKRLCSASGARSVSDLAREAMRVLLNGATREDTLRTRMDEVHSQVRNLNHKIEELSARLSVSGLGGKQ
ncbi:MAG: hypothetical protein ABSF98_06390 [Bryobacteraceae bacterium]|jgi:hypothetical protein